MENVVDKLFELNDPVALHARKAPITFYRKQTVAEAIEALRKQTSGDDIIYFYVVDSQQMLLGVVPARKLLASEAPLRMEEIMTTDITSIADTATVLEASEILLEKRLLAIPAVDSEGRLVGVIDISLFSDEVSNVLHKPAVDNAFQLIGVHVSLGRNVSPFRSFQDRFPWLLNNIAGGIVCALIASMYEPLIEVATVLALFIPVVLALSESVSMQSMTLTLQAMPADSHPWRLLLITILRELRTAVLLGLGSGLIVGSVAYVWKGQQDVSLAIGLSIALAMITACILGVLIPGVVKAMRRDPNIASGPITLALADIATLIFFFNMAGWLLSR